MASNNLNQLKKTVLNNFNLLKNSIEQLNSVEKKY